MIIYFRLFESRRIGGELKVGRGACGMACGYDMYLGNKMATKWMQREK
jgi:hypothetical protein